MHSRKTGGTWIIVLEKGEKVIGMLEDFLERENINAGYFTAIGALSSAELAHYDLERKSYTTRSITEPLEIVSLMGNVGMKGSDRIIHSHIAVGTGDMELSGGHLKEAVVAATCEVFLTVIPGSMRRTYSGDIGLNLITGIDPTDSRDNVKEGKDQ